MITCKDANKNDLIIGDKIVYVREGFFEKAIILGIGVEHISARRFDSKIVKLRNSIDGNRDILRYDW